MARRRRVPSRWHLPTVSTAPTGEFSHNPASLVQYQVLSETKGTAYPANQEPERFNRELFVQPTEILHISDNEQSFDTSWVIRGLISVIAFAHRPLSL